MVRFESWESVLDFGQMLCIMGTRVYSVNLAVVARVVTLCDLSKPAYRMRDACCEPAHAVRMVFNLSVD